MNIKRIDRFEFVGDDFKGEYEEKSLGMRQPSLSISLCVEDSITITPDRKIEWAPHASFSAISTEEDIDRLCAAAKIGWREIQKRK